MRELTVQMLSAGQSLIRRAELDTRCGRMTKENMQVHTVCAMMGSHMRVCMQGRGVAGRARGGGGGDLRAVLHKNLVSMLHSKESARLVYVTSASQGNHATSERTWQLHCCLLQRKDAQQGTAPVVVAPCQLECHPVPAGIPQHTWQDAMRQRRLCMH